MLAWVFLVVAFLAPPATAQDPAPALEGAATQIAARLDAAYAAWPSSAPGARLYVADSFATPMAGGRSFRSLLMRGFLARRYTVLDVLPPGTTADLEVLGWLAVDPQKAFVEARLVDSRSRVLIGLETRTVPFTAASQPAPPSAASPAIPPAAQNRGAWWITGGPVLRDEWGGQGGVAYRDAKEKWELGLDLGAVNRFSGFKVVYTGGIIAEGSRRSDSVFAKLHLARLLMFDRVGLPFTERRSPRFGLKMGAGVIAEHRWGRYLLREIRAPISFARVPDEVRIGTSFYINPLIEAGIIVPVGRRLEAGFTYTHLPTAVHDYISGVDKGENFLACTLSWKLF